jgi:3-mercaptopyruvate sulfurtransferase SseA
MSVAQSPQQMQALLKTNTGIHEKDTIVLVDDELIMEAGVLHGLS